MIFPSEEFKVSYEGDECTLIIADVYPEDAGQYKVVAKNDVGTAMTTCDLSVLGKQRFNSISVLKIYLKKKLNLKKTPNKDYC